MKVLLTNAESRKTFDIFNLCKRDKVDTILVSKYNSNILLRSAYQKKIHKDIYSAVDSSSSELIYFPVDEDSIATLYKDLELYSRIRSLIPIESAFKLVSDKLKLAEFCSTINIDVPEILDIDAAQKLKEIPFHMIYKPRKGQGALGLKYIESSEDLSKIENDDNYFLQKRICSSTNVEGGFFCLL